MNHPFQPLYASKTDLVLLVAGSADQPEPSEAGSLHRGSIVYSHGGFTLGVIAVIGRPAVRACFFSTAPPCSRIWLGLGGCTMDLAVAP